MAVVVAVVDAAFVTFDKSLVLVAEEEDLVGTAVVVAEEDLVEVVVRIVLVEPVGGAVDPDNQVADTNGLPLFTALSGKKRQVFSCTLILVLKSPSLVKIRTKSKTFWVFEVLKNVP